MSQGLRYTYDVDQLSQPNCDSNSMADSSISQTNRIGIDTQYFRNCVSGKYFILECYWFGVMPGLHTIGEEGVWFG